MSEHPKNCSLWGILLKEPPRFSIKIKILEHQRENNRRNKMISITARSKKQQSKLSTLKRPRTEIAMKLNTTFNIRNTSNQRIQRYSSGKRQQKYQLQLYDEQSHSRYKKNALVKFQRWPQIQLISKPESALKNCSIATEKINSQTNKQDELENEQEKASTSEKIEHSDKIERMLASEVEAFVENSKHRHKQRRILVRNNNKNKNISGYF